MSEDGSSLPQMHAIPGEFGPGNPISLDKSTLVVAAPRTGKGGLTVETKSLISSSSSSSGESSSGCVVYMQRGDGMTFVQKAILAQEVGASAVVMGNNTVAPWPYAMKDSTGESEKLRLRIPVVMIKQGDALNLVEFCHNHKKVVCSLNLHKLAKECVVCCEAFSTRQTVLQLPACGHIFHESCALLWLTKQNTCPYCRRELPTDDDEYDNERRRTQRTHAGSNETHNTESSVNAYYG